MALDPHAEVEELREELVFLRRDLHQHPETAFEEHRTSALIAERMRALGYRVQTGVGKTGVVAHLEGGGEGPCLLYRADIDALPIQEVEGRPYGSRVPGKMHACGHDGHTAIALVLAEVLARHRQRLRGRVTFVFQPAEEVMRGARAMLEDGLLAGERPQRSLGLHLVSSLPVGKVGLRAGTIWASADEFRIVVRGQGAHGATPHLSVDPVAISAQVVSSLQQVVSREVAPTATAVVTLGTIHGGTAFNIIPDQVEITGTLRTLDGRVQGFVLRRLAEVVQGVCSAHRATGEFHHLNSCPPVVNDPEAVEMVRQASLEVVGPEGTVELEPGTISDDMSLFLQEVPGCYFMVGCANPQRGITGAHHSPQFDIDEEALAIGVEVAARAVLRYLGATD